MSSSSLWTFRDLSIEELRIYAAQPCECRTTTESGLRNGYTCPAHRAQAQLDQRVVHRG